VIDPRLGTAFSALGIEPFLLRLDDAHLEYASKA
jgi:hypothetical protein